MHIHTRRLQRRRPWAHKHCNFGLTFLHWHIFFFPVHCKNYRCTISYTMQTRRYRLWRLSWKGNQDKKTKEVQCIWHDDFFFFFLDYAQNMHLESIIYLFWKIVTSFWLAFFYWLTDRISIVLDIILCSPSCFCLCFTVLHCPIVTS